MVSKADFSELSKQRCKFSVVAINHLAELQQEILQRQNSGEFNKEFADKYIPTFKFSPANELADAKSMIIVAMPRPPTKATFAWQGKNRSFILPPTYTKYDEKRVQVERAVAEEVEKKGYRIATPRLPLKLLAVRSGLAEYGRNNIAYVKGMGSFLRLTAVYTNMPCERDQWQTAHKMGQCENCTLCAKACPTGAISKDRFLLRAEKCLTYHNEKPGKVTFPRWIKPEWHNCVIGCIKCQAACPKNKPFLEKVGETAEFNEEETKLLLSEPQKERIPSATLEKMQTISLTDFLDELPRNLSALLNSQD